MTISLTRREWVGLGLGAAATVAHGRFMVMDAGAQAPSARSDDLFQQLDVFVERYMREMNAPGMTLVLADGDGVRRVATYGFADREAKTAPNATDLFQIGSITKSFAGLCLLQLRDEGKLDVHKPVAEYLPWIKVESAFAPITTHHLLTHTAGLPNPSGFFLADPAEKHLASNPPGKHFYYCNPGYELLGHLIWTLDGRILPQAFRKRILEPLGMTQTEPVITLDIRSRMAKNYVVFQNDRPFPRQGRLCEAPAIVETKADGSIASTPRDMGLYIQMIVNGGQGPNGRLVSKEGFALWTKAHVKAEDFGPTASYGYGLAVDTLDGHKLLRHTGGMVSFMSALQVDIDEGVGGFASVNAQQGYRPNPVVQYAIRLMRARKRGKSLPAVPPVDPATKVEKPGQYAGVYQSTDGRRLEFAPDGDKLVLVLPSSRTSLEINPAVPDAFTVPLDRFALVFGRASAKDPKSEVVEVGWGKDWYANEKYKGPRDFPHPPDWDAYVGHYRSESAWLGSLHIVLRKGQLWLDGLIPLEAGALGRFFWRNEPHSPDWIRFVEIVNGACMRIKASGDDFWRVAAD